MTCDKCGKHPAYENHEGDIFCDFHRDEHELWYLKQEYRTLKIWIDSTWGARLKKLTNEIATLENRLGKY